MRAYTLIASLPLVAVATPLVARQNSRAASYAGQTSSDLFPPSGTAPNTALFPDESVVGYAGPTPTGAAPFAIQTAASFPTNAAAFFPLVVPSSLTGSNFSVYKNWGNLSPMYSVNSSFYGLNTSPIAPDSCTVTQLHLVYRHGARYPTSSTTSGPSYFAAKVHNATQNATGFSATGDLSFLNTWTYKLGAEILTPFGRSQNFELGVSTRMLYGHLLDNFTAAGTLPVFRTESEDRMVKTALNFAAGFFGIPYEDQFNLELIIEAPGFNNTGAPYETCTNANVASRGSIGSSIATNYSVTAFSSTLSRLNGLVTGLNFTTADVISMLQMCAYETQALGYSQFCTLFSEDEFQKLEYYYDLSFYYNNGVGSPVAAAQGKGWVQEFVAQLTNQQITSSNSTVNSTLDSNSATFPVNQSMYAFATHEVVVLDILTALNLTALFSTGALPVNGPPSSQHSFIASQVVPFATRMHAQVLSCSDRSPSQQIRFIVNDAVLPLSYEGCSSDPDGLCALDTVVSALQKRLNEIDFDYACFGNYTAQVGVDLNGLPPKSNSTSS